MSYIRIRNLGDDTVYRLKAISQRVGKPLETYLREVLQKHALEPKLTHADKAARLREKVRQAHGGPLKTDSAALIREDREQR